MPPTKRAPARLQVKLLRDSFAAVTPRADALAATFYRILFERYPSVQPLFLDTDMASQRRKLVQALALVVANLEKPDKLEKALTEMGARHVGYGAQPAHYDAVGECFAALATVAGPLWSPRLEKAWADAYSVVATLARAGAQRVPSASTSPNEDAVSMSTTRYASRSRVSVLTGDGGAVSGGPGSAVDDERDALLADYAGQIEAINKSNAVIEFNLDGTIISANANFLKTLGYTLDEVRGRHHSMFCREGYRDSHEYRDFWAKLNRGEFDSGEYLRVGKGGREVWIQASYNPIRDREGRLAKVVKYASDITQMVTQRAEAALFKPMVEGANLNIMFADKDMTLKYMNPASMKVLKTLEALLPVPVEQMVGQKIDIFHKKPEYQRGLLTNDAQLPRKAKIQLGPETLELNVVPIYDGNQQYVGPMVSWEVITAKVALARDVQAVVHVVSSSSTELEASATGMAASAEETNRQSQAVAAASEQATRNVQTVASSAEQLTASIREIASRVQEASSIAQQAVQQAASTTDTMGRLGQSSQEIGQVVKVITSIAQQTNLLALNATIEAARAGEAGKGFAVVANEVKELARQTAKATEEIGTKIAGVQAETNQAVAAIKDIATVIGKISEISTTIAGAVEEQNAATGEISRNVGEAARGTADVSYNIASVTQVAQDTGRTAEAIKVAATGLSQEAEKLAAAVSSFVNRND